MNLLGIAHRAHFGGMAYHEQFWVVAGTAAPVLALTAVVAIRGWLSRAWRVINEGGLFSTAVLVYALAAGQFAAEFWVFTDALNSLGEGHDVASPARMTIFLQAALGLLVAQVVAEAVMRAGRGGTRHQPSP